MVVHHLNCGTLRPIGARLVNGEGGYVDPARIVCHCRLLETDRELVLVDTGLGLAEMEDPWSRLGRLPAGLLRLEQDATRTAIRQLRALGFDPGDVRHI